MMRKTAAAGFAAIEGFLDRIVCVLGAAALAQAPEFFQQYLQRLGGHLEEARRQLAQFEAAAQAAGKPLAKFIADTAANGDAGLAKLGGTMRETAERVEALAGAQQALLDASVWSRPWVFFDRCDFSIARATAAVFKPAVPTTLEGAMYAAVGVAVAFALWHVAIRLPLKRVLHPRASVITPGARAV